MNRIIVAIPMGDQVHVSFDNNTFELMDREKFIKLKEEIKKYEEKKRGLKYGTTNN